MEKKIQKCPLNNTAIEWITLLFKKKKKLLTFYSYKNRVYRHFSFFNNFDLRGETNVVFA